MQKQKALGFAVLLVAIDQVIKRWIVGNLAGKASVSVIPNLFRLTYVENYGAAFGIFRGKTLLLCLVVFGVLSAILWMICSNRIQSNALVWILSLVAAGGAGNLIDRVRLGYVVDYLDFSALFGFPVFNFADCCVVVGTVLLLFYVLKYDVLQNQKDDKDETEEVEDGSA